MLIKGLPGKTEQVNGTPFSGEDRIALEAALEALGWGSANWTGVLLEPVGLPALAEEQLRFIVEVNDPEVVVALDDYARQALQQAMAIRGGALDTGEGVEAGESLATTTGFAAGLATTAGEPLAAQALYSPSEADSPTTIQVGELLNISGRQILALDDFASALSDAQSKQSAWAQLKQIRR